MEVNDLDSDIVSLNVTGMTCAACASSVERVLSNMHFVDSVSVNLPLEKVIISINGGLTAKTVEDCIEVVEKAGFGAHEVMPALTVRENNELELRKRFYSMVLAFVLTLPVFVFSMILGDMGRIGPFDLRLFLAMLATFPVYFVSGAAFHKGAWRSILRGTGNMDVLIHLGTTVAMLWSCLVVNGASIAYDS